jgi:hypothetical protein
MEVGAEEIVIAAEDWQEALPPGPTVVPFGFGIAD